MELDLEHFGKYQREVAVGFSAQNIPLAVPVAVTVLADPKAEASELKAGQPGQDASIQHHALSSEWTQAVKELKHAMEGRLNPDAGLAAPRNQESTCYGVGGGSP